MPDELRKPQEMRQEDDGNLNGDPAALHIILQRLDSIDSKLNGMGDWQRNIEGRLARIEEWSSHQRESQRAKWSELIAVSGFISGMAAVIGLIVALLH